MPIFERPYAVLIAKDLAAPGLKKSDRSLLLTLTYLLSEHIQFGFPMPGEMAPVIDASFDEVLRGLSLKSKGITYLKDCDLTEERRLASGAALILTTDIEVEQFFREKNIPGLYLTRQENQNIVLRLSHLDKLGNEDLKSQVIGCARLINLLSEGVLSRGHFSLSW